MEAIDEDIYLNKLKEYEKLKVINYLGHRSDIQDIMKKSSCIVTTIIWRRKRNCTSRGCSNRKTIDNL
ncbi:hypothetical protein Q5M85_12155 [Paraclostridium bifermentans]|nr:hypothetical protein [Paraclostridium bifermentans]